MKFTYNWLKEFVNIKISAQELADKLTMAGLEVVGLDQAGEDFVFEVEITSNRPDWLSVVGIAREVAAVTGGKLKLGARLPVRQAGKNRKPKTENPDIAIKIEDKKDCPLYTARIIRDVQVGPSPGWLKHCLESIGCRSINNVVDITNYIMFTWGQPLHAFDLDKLNSDTIVVRRASSGEKLTLIDAAEKLLDKDILVIATPDKPVAVAGVMGGKDTEVGLGTRNLLLEAAVFNPVVVRASRRKLAIGSDSSYRFERGVDLGEVEHAARQSAKLITELAKGKLVLSKSSPVSKVKVKSIALEPAFVEKILGIDKIPAEKIKKILSSLGFTVKMQAKNKFKVVIPSYRPDVNQKEDLIEEVARIFGYENIPNTLPAVIPQFNPVSPRDLVCRIKEMLAGLGLNEVITHSLISRDGLSAQILRQGKLIEVLNPLSEEQEILRPGLYLSLLKCVAHNLNQKQNHISVFEIAKGFCSVSGQFKEELKLGLCLCGTKPHFFPQGLVKDELGFLHLKGILEAIFQCLGIKDYSFRAKGIGHIDVLVKKEQVGIMISPSAELLDGLDIKNRNVVVAEILLERIFAFADLTKKFNPLPQYPGISRDISVVLKEEISSEEVLRYIEEKAAGLLRQVGIADYYKGRQIPPGFKGLTISCFYRSQERTLTEAEISPLHAQIAGILQEKFGAQIR